MKKSLADNVTHGELLGELAKIKEAILLMVLHLENEIGRNDLVKICDLLRPPGEL